MSIPDLQPTKLGTKEHWDHVYEEELANFEEMGDEGEIWFGIESLEKMVDWTVANVPPLTNASILEVGSGNGTLLFALLEAGYSARTLSGVDYSPDAVKLSKSIAKAHGGEEITLSICNFLEEDPQHLSQMKQGGKDVWDLILDKGTFDAVALAQKDENRKSPVIIYRERIAQLLRPGGYLLITSCNFTEDELKVNFTAPGTNLVYHSRLQHPTYTFGGKTGSICSSVAFQKKE